MASNSGSMLDKLRLPKGAIFLTLEATEWETEILERFQGKCARRQKVGNLREKRLVDGLKRRRQGWTR